MYHVDNLFNIIEMKKIRPYILPIAIIFGLFFHKYCAVLKVVVPYLVFCILFLNFVAVKLKNLRMCFMDIYLIMFQITVSIGMYFILKLLGFDEIVAQSVLVGVLCPVAASVVVIAGMLGANKETLTTYAIMGNLMVAVVAPIYFSFIGVHQDMPFWTSFLIILKKIGGVIALPFFVAWILEQYFKKESDRIAKFSGLSFYLWAMALCITIGQTIDFLMLSKKDDLYIILWIAVFSLIFCVIQFGVGRKLGKHYGDVVAGGQLLGQKNTAIGIWMATTYLNPLASLFPALYSVWQNVFNSWQLWRYKKS